MPPISASSVSDEQVRDAVNAWAHESVWGIRYLGEKIDIHSIESQIGYTIHLESQYEVRSVSDDYEPYSHEPLDDRGRVPGLWEIPFQAPQPCRFERRSHTYRLPHSEWVSTCPKCNGAGAIICSNCSGEGRTTCERCKGQGWYITSASGSRAGTRQTCRSCSGNGKVLCRTCKSGKICWSGCAGRTKVRFFRRLNVKFAPIKIDEAYGKSRAPDRLILESTVALLHEDKATPAILTQPPIEPNLDRFLSRVLSASRATERQNTRLLFQSLQVRAAVVHQVTYSYRSGPERRLWLYGRDHKVYAPDAPWRWWLPQLAILAVAGAVVLVLGGIFLALLAR
jgi:hypothetical protein